MHSNKLKIGVDVKEEKEKETNEKRRIDNVVVDEVEEENLHTKSI